MAAPRILIAGVGNIFLGDDGFGVEVAQRLLRLAWPTNIRVVDFGIRGIDLTYSLLDGYDRVVLIDAAPRGHPPGTLSIIQPEPAPLPAPSPPSSVATIDPHSMEPVRVLEHVRAMGGDIRRMLVLACEPAHTTSNNGDMIMGLSPPVQAAVDEAVRMVLSMVAELSASPTTDTEHLTPDARCTSFPSP